MARRIGDVKEFGFRPIPDDDNYASSFSQPLADSEDIEATGVVVREGAAKECPADDLGPGQDNPKGGTGTSWLPFNKVAEEKGSTFSSWMPWSSSKKPEVDNMHVESTYTQA